MIRHLALVLLAATLTAQVYSPKVLREGQPDATDLKNFADAIYRNANAVTPRERAEAIWRFFLTDGRFVEPGFWYHIAGWAYEEPIGEVLDPIKLLNSYGFGLCYHIAPLLAAVFEAGGFQDARVWFLTGHTVAEVFYDGAYHYFDSDMMGYSVAGGGSFKGKDVVSVSELERNPKILLDKLSGPKTVRAGAVDNPWYPADVRAGAIEGLASLFTSTNDNYLFPFTRYATGHDMSYVLRPGEKLIRYFKPEEPGLFYLPYAFDGTMWREFPREIARYRIRTEDGPHSQKDHRLWATGRIEFTPPKLPSGRTIVIPMPSPWVVIDAQFSAKLKLDSEASSVQFETSTDGQHWDTAATVKGPFDGIWTGEPKVIHRSEHGRLTAVSGSYGYQLRITKVGPEPALIDALKLTTRVQLNPRTLPALTPGENSLVYESGAAKVRQRHAVPLDRLASAGLQVISEEGQDLLCPASSVPGEAVLELADVTGFDVSARFIQIDNGLAPDKLTAETRRTDVKTRPGSASIEWSSSANGPWRTEWTFPAKPEWLDTNPVHRTLLWPEAHVSVHLPNAAPKAFVRFRTAGPCIDNVRLTEIRNGSSPAGKLRITHDWTENGRPKRHVEIVDATERQHAYRIKTDNTVDNVAITFEAVQP